MNKEEMKTMIAETIMPNNKKAITAQSLANVLTTMAENSGEGGGDALVYCILDGGDMELTPEQKAHNAESFKKLIQERVDMKLAAGTDILTEVDDNVEFYFTGADGVKFKVVCSMTTGEYIRLEEIPSPSRSLRVWMNDENTPEQTAENVATFNTLMNVEGTRSVVIAIQTEVRGANGIVGCSTSYTTPTSVAVVKMYNPDNESYIVVSFKSQDTTVTIKLHADGTLEAAS